MAQTPAPPADPEHTRFVEPVVRPVVKATDLGSVVVLKQANQYLLTDPFGDIRPDTRGLGLYDGDTRRLSCSILRVNGTRPVLLQASAGGNWRGTIQMTNPRIERDLRDKVLRHVTDAFREDPVRILRVARFAARFHDFSVAPETMALMRGMVEAGEQGCLFAEIARQADHLDIDRHGRQRFGDVVGLVPAAVVDIDEFDVEPALDF